MSTKRSVRAAPKTGKKTGRKSTTLGELLAQRPNGNGHAKPAKPRTEPLFELSLIAGCYGSNYGLEEDRTDPLFFARNALDDARRVLLAIEHALVGDVDRSALQDLACNAAQRAEVADAILNRFTMAAEVSRFTTTAEVSS